MVSQTKKADMVPATGMFAKQTGLLLKSSCTRLIPPKLISGKSSLFLEVSSVSA